MAKTRSQTRSPSLPKQSTIFNVTSRSPNRGQKKSVIFFTACRHVLDSRKKQDRSGERWTKIARLVPGFCRKCKSEMSSKKLRGNSHKLPPRPAKTFSYYNLLVQANAKNLGDGDLASAKKSFMFTILKECFDADGNIRDDDIRYLYTCIEGLTEETLDWKVKDEEKEQKEAVWEGQFEDEESDPEDVVAEQFKIFWKERQERKKENEEEVERYEILG